MVSFFARQLVRAAMSPRLLVLCGPSGSGKSTLVRRLMDDYADCFGFSVSHTTRAPRPGEVDGVHYHFVSRDQMTQAIERGDFLESACFSGNYYGTSKAAVARVAAQDRICVLDIDVQGVRQVRTVPELDPLLVFVKPPTLESLEQRLRARGTETEESLRKRLEAATHELEYGEAPGNFHLIVVNDELETSYTCLRDFLLPEIQACRKAEKKGLAE
ncbi:hypothetical protein B566_EDAN002828 [Ephemera danica]|nr:hypothetical protein B566_EDAN002828 [Ephemera danica]